MEPPITPSRKKSSSHVLINKRRGKYLPASYVLVVILLHILPTGSLLTRMGGSWFPVEPDFLVHLLLFAPWMAAGRLLEKKNPGWAKPGCQISWFILGLFVAAGAESLQYVLYYRVFSPADLALNSIGVLAGWMLLTVFSKIKKS